MENKQTTPRDREKVSIKVEDSIMKDSINRKAQQERVHAIDSTRGVPNQLVEQRCIEFGD